MLIQMHLITLFRIMNTYQRCLQAKVIIYNEPKQVMPKSQYLRRSIERKSIWTLDTGFPTIFNKSCTYITAVKHRQLRYGHPRRQTVHLAGAATHIIHISVYNTCTLLLNNEKYVDANLDAPGPIVINLRKFARILPCYFLYNIKE